MRQFFVKAKIWRWISERNNREILQFLVVFFSAILGAIWAVYTVRAPFNDSVNNSISTVTYSFNIYGAKSPEITANGEFSSAMCNSTHHDILRYGRSYRFYETINASENDYVRHITNLKYSYKEEFDYNLSKGFPEIGFTKKFIDNNGYIYPSDSYRFIESNGEMYEIRAIPKLRSPNNLVLKYTKSERQWLNREWSKLYESTSCIYYEISWCGDGIIEEKFDEECDPNAPTFDKTICDEMTCKMKRV